MKNDYTTIDGSVDYREIARIMTENGFKMNHSSVRNYVIRIMKKFADAYVLKHNLNVPSSRMYDVASSSNFQRGISDVLRSLEDENDKTTKQNAP